MSINHRRLGHRKMRQEDVSACVELVASHPVLGARYGYEVLKLDRVWGSLIGLESAGLVVFEEIIAGRATIWGVGVSVFVNDAFIDEVKTPPLFWVGPELMRRVAAGNSPLLSDRQLREANAVGGLNLVVWEGCIRAEDSERPELYSALIVAFLEEHRGFLLKEVIAAQAESAERLVGMLNTGGMLLRPDDGRWSTHFDADPQQVVSSPHVIGLSRDNGKRPGSWIDLLFNRDAPRFGLTRAQQALLFAAPENGTDEDLALALGVSLSAVKKTWCQIYARVAAVSPELTTYTGRPGQEGRRGKEKKRQVLRYVREHPEELRPVARSHLRML